MKPEDFTFLGSVSRDVGNGIDTLGHVTTDLYECPHCGAVATDPERHIRHHRASSRGMDFTGGLL